MEPPIDIEHFETATFGDRALQREVLGLFEAQAAKLLQIIRTKSGKEQSEAAHALKGAARGIGAFTVADEAEKVERGETGAVETLASRVADASRAAASLLAKD
ncbi:MAG: Hpt domain-containing protein [Xanthobacteraceae bacterium]|nr:Hpt domain-containing protein [Xanthobacteraceae bacterium]